MKSIAATKSQRFILFEMSNTEGLLCSLLQLEAKNSKKKRTQAVLTLMHNGTTVLPTEAYGMKAMA